MQAGRRRRLRPLYPVISLPGIDARKPCLPVEYIRLCIASHFGLGLLEIETVNSVMDLIKSEQKEFLRMTE